MTNFLRSNITMNIKEAAEMVGVSTATIRNWEKAGLIHPERANNKYRTFTLRDIEKLQKIKSYSIHQKISHTEIYKLMEQEETEKTSDSSPTVTKQMLGKRWRDYRLERKLSIAQVSSAIGISPSYLSKIESAHANVSFDILQRLASFYGENIFYYYRPDNTFFHQKNSTHALIDIEGINSTPLSYLKGGTLGIVLFDINPLHAHKESDFHYGEEFIYVLEGSIRIQVEKAPVTLSAGEAMHFFSRATASWENPSQTQSAKVLWVHHQTEPV